MMHQVYFIALFKDNNTHKSNILSQTCFPNVEKTCREKKKISCVCYLRRLRTISVTIR